MAWIDLGSKRCGQAISVFTNQHSHQKMDGTQAKCYWKCDFSFNPHARLFVGWLVGLSVDGSVRHNDLKGGKLNFTASDL